MVRQRSVDISLPRADSAGGVARRMARNTLARWGVLDESVLETVDILISELATNAVRHTTGAIALSLVLDAGLLTINVADQSGHPPVLREPSIDGGFGLRLVEALAERWGVRDHLGRAKTVWATILVPEDDTE
ncbi:ATP-binding protein [Hamadaea tsunoensis]|uniref:ATP-binding protein n=1 Tax=Hamadaea tsunoensis TaxID=53368 RepID=UPI00041341B4|nr:ATP-binding protein [Hamadaea tsunoensis]